ncbi:MAG: TrmH family RNA methyltransferase [Leptolyngbya sp. IPPAS B-1204]|nr:RNA methyltransferase [Elainella sp. C42_A2020_010]RNJ66525.1 MAG: RNA methyltransferase [Leptolyngbya sp. IPPAS B-1204]
MLTSLQNPLVKKLRKLHRAKERREQALFLLEGTHLLQEACAVAYPLETVCCTPDWQAAHPLLWQQVSQQAQRVELVSPEVLQAIATTVNPDGVVATARRVEQSLNHQSLQLGVALETLQDPGNLGTVIRTSAAVGADGLWLSYDSVDLDHPKVLRASAGQWFRLPMRVSPDLATDLQQLQAEGIQLVATLPTASHTYWQVDFTRPTVVLLGNEGAGLSPQLTEIADIAVKIPLAAGVESLNVGIAAALILYEARRQRNSGF